MGGRITTTTMTRSGVVDPGEDAIAARMMWHGGRGGGFVFGSVLLPDETRTITVQMDPSAS